MTQEEAIRTLESAKAELEKVTDDIYSVMDETSDRRGMNAIIPVDTALRQLISWLDALKAEEDEAQRQDAEAERMIDGWIEEFEALHPEEA